MNRKVPDGVEVWKQFEDLLIPGLRLSVIERAVYSHLLRHSRLEGKQRLQFSIGWCARGVGLSTFSVRKGVRRLAAKGALLLAERSKKGHVIEVRLPAEVRGVRARKIAEGAAERLRGAANLEGTRRLSGKAGAAGSDPRARGRLLLLLPAARDRGDAVLYLITYTPAGADGTEWLSQPGFELLGMQFAERRAEGGGFPALAVPRGAFRERRTEGAAASAGEDGVRQDAAGGCWGEVNRERT